MQLHELFITSEPLLGYCMGCAEVGEMVFPSEM